MDKKFNITPDEEALYARNRELTPYVRTFEEDGISYPIPDLIGSSRLIAIDEDTVGAKEITFGYSEFAPGSSVHKPHIHPDCEEVMYILKGRGISGLNGMDFICKEKDILFVPKGAEHYFYNPFDESCCFVFLYTKGSLKGAGYTVASNGYNEIGGDVEALQKSGVNRFDSE